jgi:hypothetical protein
VTGQTYCIPGPSSTADTNLGAVTLYGDAPSSIQDTTNCPKVTNARNLTALSVDLSPGGSYTIRYDVTVCSTGSFYASLVGAWIDYDRDGVFAPTESLFPFAYHAGGVIGASQSFVVPSTVTSTGPTRLRIQLQETSLSTIDPCYYFTYGATKDYTVNIKPSSLYCNCGPTSDEDTHMGPAIFRGETRDIVQYNPPCPGALGPVNFTDQLVTLRQGETYPLSLSVITCRKAYPNIISAAWIDFNGDQIWDPVREQVLPFTNRFGALFAMVTVPIDARPGPTAMRAMVQEMLSGGSTIGPCDMFTYGGTQDYPVQILAAGEADNSGVEAGMLFREPAPIMGAGMPVGEGMSFREKQDDQVAIPEATTSKKGKGKCPKKLALEKAGMRYREQKEAGMNYREMAP